MRKKDILTKWNFYADDWITSVDIIDGKFIILGSRNGDLFLLNWFGVLLQKTKFDSWVGAIRVLNNLENSFYILVGTKLGTLSYAVVNTINYSIDSHVFYKAKNTIREIDIINNTEEKGDFIIGVGSEDKSVYVFSFKEILKNTSNVDVLIFKLNGWVRSVSFIRYNNYETLLIAGCGDKFLHIFKINGSIVLKQKISVFSKVHSILTNKSTNMFFAVSDSKKFYVLAPNIIGDLSYKIISEVELPHRATKICFNDDSCTLILILCEDKSVYVYNISEAKLTGAIKFKDKGFAIKGIRSRNTNDIFIGLGINKFSCISYVIDNNVEYILNDELILGTVEESYRNQFIQFYLFGKNEILAKVGIGRFLHLVTTTFNQNAICLIGTDEGELKIVDLKTKTEIRTPKIFDDNKVRIWSVYAYWESQNLLKLFISTSDKEILEIWLLFSGNEFIPSNQNSIKISDWARELRGMDNNKIIAATESGEIIIISNSEIQKTIQGNQVFRSIFARETSHVEYEILTGSDNNQITFYKNENIIWSISTSDRVRETLINNDEFIAVSEDRFLYIYDRNGNYKLSFKFPHRALCVETYEVNNKPYYIVGCGDGNVYIVTNYGFIHQALCFPDRIRDVKIYNNENLIIACEDLNLYLSPLTEMMINSTLNIHLIEFINTIVKPIVNGYEQKGVIEIHNLTISTKLVLLDLIEYWYESSKLEFTISLLDSCLENTHEYSGIRQFYILSNALINIAIKVDFAIGKSRIEKYLTFYNDNFYAHHSILVCITKHKLWVINNSNQFVDNDNLLLETIIYNIDLKENWIKSECLNHLFRSGFYNIGQMGFYRFYDKNKIRYQKLDIIISESYNSKYSDIFTSELITFLTNLNSINCFADLFNSFKEPNPFNKWFGFLKFIDDDMNALKCLDSILTYFKINCLNDLTTILNQTINLYKEQQNCGYSIYYFTTQITLENPEVSCKEYLLIQLFKKMVKFLD